MTMSTPRTAPLDSPPRIAPLEPPYPPDTEAALRKWMPPGSPLAPLLLFRTLMVNDELASNNSTLHLLGNDLKNLLESTVIPIVMVDGGLRIRRITPIAEAVFKVLPSDIGRSITDIKPDLDVDLKPLLTTVLRDVVNLEREVRDQKGRWYRLQIRP